MRSREVVARLAARALDRGCRTLYRVVDAGLEHVPARGPAVVVFSHRRDADAPLIGNRILGPGRLGGYPFPRTMARDDLFRPGFLAAYLRGWPWWLRRALGRVPVAGFLRLLEARPIRRIEERTLAEVLDDVHAALGNLPLVEVLRPRWLQRFTAAAGGAPPVDLDGARHSRHEDLLLRPGGLKALKPRCLHVVAAAQRRAVGRQLAGFVAHLRGGGTLLLAPEGVVSEDGRLGRLRAALPALLDGAPATRVVPAAVTYDFMSRRRARAYLRFGAPLAGLAGQDPATADELVRRALLGCWTVTATQLAGTALYRRAAVGRPLGTDELEAEMNEAAARWQAAGLPLAADLLTPRARARRLADVLAWAERDGLVTRRGALAWPTAGAAAAASWRSPAGSPAYAANELAALGELLGPAPAPAGSSALEDLEETAN